MLRQPISMTRLSSRFRHLPCEWTTLKLQVVQRPAILVLQLILVVLVLQLTLVLVLVLQLILVLHHHMCVRSNRQSLRCRHLPCVLKRRLCPSLRCHLVLTQCHA